MIVIHKQIMVSDFKIKETADINIEGGFIINGFPSTG